jgi:SPP1 gp7 family putative phage head morphogenesis protein
MNFTAWEARRQIENKYKTALRKLGRFLLDLIGEDDNAHSITSKLWAFGQSDEFAAWAQSLAHTFVTNTLEENAKTWRQAARMSGQGRDIHRALQREFEGPVGVRVRELVKQNAQYIKSVPGDAAERLTRHVASEAMKGSRTAFTTEEFKDYVGQISMYHAKLISRTESAKSMSALTQARAEYLGRDWYIWHSSEDQRVRKSHQNMDGVLCRFSDPPEPETLIGEDSYGKYGPGGIFNCRCYAEPIIIWDEIEWPMRVYYDGSIKTLTVNAFKDRFGGDAR